MGTSKTGTLSAIQTAETLQNRNVMSNLGSGGSGKFVFFAAFDGTNNDRSNVGLSGSAHQTNVANLYDQAKANESDTFRVEYYPGVGTGGQNGNLLNAAISPTEAIHYAAGQALSEFSERARDYLRANPDATVADITASAVGFSRGSATAVVFARMLQERGLVTADGTVVAPPGSIQVNGLALMDPVYSFITGDLSIPPNVTGPVLVVRAINENRLDFAAADHSNDSRVTTLGMYGNHCGIGGGLDLDGTSAAVLEGVTGYLQSSGVALSNVPPELSFNPDKPAQLYTELYQTARNGDVVTDENGEPIKVWREAEGESRATKLVPLTDKTHATPVAEGDDPRNEQDKEEIPVPALAHQIAPGAPPNLGGAYGAGQINGLDVLPFSETSHFLVNSEGDIVGEMSLLDNGAVQLKNLSGNTGYLVGDQILTQAQYEEAQAKHQESQSAQQAASALGLMNSIIGLQHWDAMSDLQRVAAVTSIYNAADTLLGDSLPGNLAAGASMLGLLSALDQGNVGAAMVSGISLVNSLTNDAASKAIGAALNIDAGNVVPGLSLILALDSGDPVSILAAAANFIPVYGQIISICITIFGSLFGGDDDIPMSEGAAHAQWDAAGNLQIVTDQDVEGGGPTATQWMSALANGLQAELARHSDEHGNPLYGLVPNLLPTIGFKHDPDGFNYQSAQGHLFLSWVDDHGVTQTRYYDGAGNRNDGSGETLAGDFMKHAMDAIAPAWAVQTTLAHWQAGEGLHLPTEKASLPQESADGITQTLQVLTLAAPGFEPPRQSLIDVDGDGYLEATQWVQANQAMLAIDVNGDGYIGAGELLNLLNGNSFNSLNWLDADGDGQLNASDPAFAALRLWMDVNGDGISQSWSDSEAQTLAQAGITAIDFSGDAPRVEYADGSTRELTAQMLTTDTLGVSYRTTQGGLLEISEQADGSGAAVLSAINTREFDGRAGHVHGGEVATATDAIQVEAGDERLVSTGNATVSSTSDRTHTMMAEGDARLRQGASGTAVAGQAQGSEPPTALAGPARRNAVTFVPMVAVLPGAALAEATTSMVRSADASGLDAATWAAVATAAGATASASAASVAEQTGQALGEWPLWTAVRSETAPSPEPVPAGESAYTSTQAVPSSTQAEASPVVFVREREWSTTDRLLPGGGVPSDGVLPGAQVGAGTVATVATQPAVAAEGASSASAPAPTPLAPAASTTPVANAAMAAAEIMLAYPVAVGERLEGREDTGLRIPAAVLLANDTTTNMSALRIVAVDQPRHGQVSMAADGSILFVPDLDFHGEAGFRYTVSDDHGLQHSAWAGVNLASVNDAPMVHGEMAEGDEDRVFLFSSGSLLANDTDADITTDGDVLRIARVDEPQHGSVDLLSDGSVRFVPDANYHGPAGFTYWVADVAGVEVAATVSLTVHPVNDLPVVTGEVIDNDEDVVLRIDPALLLANDNDVDTVTSGQVLAIGAVSGARHGSVALLHDGRIEFTPEANYVGNASFAYRVDDGAGGQVWTTAVLVLAPVNDAPATVDDSLRMDEDTPLVIEQALLLANDSDIDNLHTDLRIVAVDHATHGTVSMGAEGALHFVPEPDYFGSASFTYTVSDGAGGFTVGTARIEVAPVNDAPRLVGEQVRLDEDTVAHFTQGALLANDSDVDNAHAELVITGVGDAVNGTVALVAGEIVFTPTLNHFGPASFTYTVSDGVGGLSAASVALTFDPVNDVPVANGELLRGKRDVSYTLTQAVLLANDTDMEDPTGLRIVGISNVQNGSAVLKADGSVNFVPEAGFSGLGRFDYIVQDPQGAQSVATAQIDFSRINVTPVATDDSFIGFEDVPFSISSAQLLANDSDADNPASELRVAAVANAVNGTVSLDAQGQVRFVPVADHVGTASFRYRVEDSDGGGTWATVVLTVQAVNDPPVIEDIWYGRPFYGYRKEIRQNQDRESFEVYVTVTDPATAKALLASGQSLYLQHRTTSNDESQQALYAYTAYAPTYYRNGMVRPLSVDSLDALDRSQVSDNDPVFTPVDDRYRQNGAVVAYDPDGNSAALEFGVGSTPQHGHAWANRYIPSSVSAGLWYPNVEPYGIPEKGAWQYFAHLGDTFTGADPFTISVTDSGGATTHVTINASHLGSSVSGGGGGCPLVIDLSDDGIDLIRPEDSNVFMDINGDGWRDRIGWAAPSDAVLVLDANQDGRVDIDHEVSFVDHLPGARTDLDGLAAHDSNGDGWITAADDRWQDFGLFQDRNGNGVRDEGEFVSLDAAGLRGISLMREGVPEMNQGNVVFGTSAVEWADGRTARAGDVMFAGHGVPLPEAALQALATSPLTPVLAPSTLDAELAQAAQMALLFNQMAALPACPACDPPAAFVPPVVEDVIEGWVTMAASSGASSVAAVAA